MDELKFDGERVVPNNTTPTHILKEHSERYIFARKYIKNKIILDIACGTGYGSFKLARSGAKKVIGGDISKRAINYASEKYKRDNLSFKEINGESLSLPDSSIDIVISFETIEHLSNYRVFLNEIKRVLKDNGVLICSSPNKTITSPFTKKPLNTFHIKEFKIKEFIQIFNKTGFKKIEVYGQSFINNNMKFRLKNFIRSYFGFVIKFYKKLPIYNKSFESAKDNSKIRRLKKRDLEPTYFILVAKIK